MKILLNGKASLEDIFAELDIDTFRAAFRQAQVVPERIPAKLKPLIAMETSPKSSSAWSEKQLPDINPTGFCGNRVKDCVNWLYDECEYHLECYGG